MMERLKNGEDVGVVVRVGIVKLPTVRQDVNINQLNFLLLVSGCADKFIFLYFIYYYVSFAVDS